MGNLSSLLDAGRQTNRNRELRAEGVACTIALGTKDTVDLYSNFMFVLSRGGQNWGTLSKKGIENRTNLAAEGQIISTELTISRSLIVCSNKD